MTEMSATELQSVRMSALPEISPATNEDAIAYVILTKLLKLLFWLNVKPWLWVSAINRYFYF